MNKNLSGLFVERKVNYEKALILFFTLLLSIIICNCENNITKSNTKEVQIEENNVKGIDIKSVQYPDLPDEPIAAKDLNPFDAEIKIVTPNSSEDLVDLNNLENNSNIFIHPTSHPGSSRYWVKFKVIDLPLQVTPGAFSYKMYIDGVSYYGPSPDFDINEGEIHTTYIWLPDLEIGNHTVKIRFYYYVFGNYYSVSDTKQYKVYESIQGMHIDGPNSVPSGSYADFTAVLEGGTGLNTPIYEWWVKRVSDVPLERGITTRAPISDEKWHKLDDTDNQIHIGLDLYEHYIKCIVNNGEFEDIKFVNTY